MKVAPFIYEPHTGDKDPRLSLLNGTAMRSILTVTGGSSQARWFARPQTASLPLRLGTTNAMISGRVQAAGSPWSVSEDPRSLSVGFDDNCDGILANARDSLSSTHPWTTISDSSHLKYRLRRVLPLTETMGKILSTAPRAPNYGATILELDGVCSTRDDLKLVLATLRKQHPFTVRTLSLRQNHGLFKADNFNPTIPRESKGAEAALKMLAEFVAEHRENPPEMGSITKRSMSVCLECLMLGDVTAATESIFAEHEKHLQLLLDAWGTQGVLHEDPRRSATDDGGKHYLRALTLRRKIESYNPTASQRAMLMPAWAMEAISNGNGRKIKGGSGKKKKKGKKKK